MSDPGRRIVRVGDPGSHGGQVVTGSPDVDVNLIPMARIGDIYDCPIHGPNPIVTGSPDSDCNLRAIARVGDKTQCGATLVDGSPDTFCN